MKNNSNVSNISEKFGIHVIRQDFPILTCKVNGKALVYFDNAATTQLPKVVIDRVTKFYSHENANIHRGVYYLSQKATEEYENSRSAVASFINCESEKEIIFVRNATEAINLVANCYVLPHLKAEDEILVSMMEHHSNIVPWQLICNKRGAKLKVIPITDNGEVDLESFEKLLNNRTKILAITHVSNAIGTINPIKEMIRKAHSFNTKVIVDGAQAIQHVVVDVQYLDCDFYVFSGHKVYAPGGIGVLWGHAELLQEMEPYQGGGDMILKVTFDKTTFNEIPMKFEAGTPNIAGAIGLHSALTYLRKIGLMNVFAYEHALTQYALKQLHVIPRLKIIGEAANRIGTISFVLEDAHPHDIAFELDRYGIAVRAGHHCAQPLMDRYGVVATTRVSLAFYNTFQEIDNLISIIPQIQEKFKL